MDQFEAFLDPYSLRRLLIGPDLPPRLAHLVRAFQDASAAHLALVVLWSDALTAGQDVTLELRECAAINDLVESLYHRAAAVYRVWQGGHTA